MSYIQNQSGGGGTGGLTVGVTTIAGGTNGYVLYDNNGVLGEEPGGGTNDSGWLQTLGSPGNTTTTPINAPGGSNQDGPNIYMFAGNADGTGIAGTIILQIASGAQATDPDGTPITGVVLLDTQQINGANFIFSQPYVTGASNFGQGIGFNAGNSDGGGGALVFTSGQGLFGGQVEFNGGIGNGEGGGSFAAVGGPDTGDGDGGGAVFITGQSNGNGNGGDILFSFGSSGGIGRRGLFFPNLPTSDPSVSGAEWSNNGVHMDSGVGNVSGTITTAQLTTLGSQGSMTFVNGILTSQVAAT